MANAKESVKLRKRLMSSGNSSLYLDIYIEGKRSYEYLKLYLVPETNRAAKEKNRQTLHLAEAIKAKRILEVQNGKFGFEGEYHLDTNFLDYFQSLCERRNNTQGSLGNWKCWWSTFKYLEKYCSADMTFRFVTSEWVRGFKYFLDHATSIRHNQCSTKGGVKLLSQNSKVNYFNKLRACINQAVDDRILPHNPLRGVEGFKAEEKERVYLTVEDVRAMAAGECRYPVLKRAFLFSCLTGIRKSDIEKMQWLEVRQEGDFTRIVFKQKKTGGQEYMDISSEAVPYLGERGGDEDLVFCGFHYSSYLMKELRAWAKRSGVMKPITFHSGRHTFAVLMLNLGADIYTVQKLLGHRELSTTEVYAHIVDKKKQAAVAMIPHISISESKLSGREE